MTVVKHFDKEAGAFLKMKNGRFHFKESARLVSGEWI